MWVYLQDIKCWVNLSRVDFIYYRENGDMDLYIVDDKFTVKNELDKAKINYYLESYAPLYRDLKCSQT